jgi:hypothetical protein
VASVQSLDVCDEFIDHRTETRSLRLPFLRVVPASKEFFALTAGDEPGERKIRFAGAP